MRYVSWNPIRKIVLHDPVLLLRLLYKKSNTRYITFWIYDLPLLQSITIHWPFARITPWLGPIYGYSIQLPTTQIVNFHSWKKSPNDHQVRCIMGYAQKGLLAIWKQSNIQAGRFTLYHYREKVIAVAVIGSGWEIWFFSFLNYPITFMIYLYYNPSPFIDLLHVSRLDWDQYTGTRFSYLLHRLWISTVGRKVQMTTK